MHRFIPLIASELGFRVAEIPVTHHARKHGVVEVFARQKSSPEIPDLLTLFFLMKYTRRPLHFFGRIGSILFLLWIRRAGIPLGGSGCRGIGIGTRPLLTFGVLLVLIGGQTVFTGLLADLIVNMNQKGPQVFPLKYSSDGEQEFEDLRV